MLLNLKFEILGVAARNIENQISWNYKSELRLFWRPKRKNLSESNFRVEPAIGKCFDNRLHSKFL